MTNSVTSIPSSSKTAALAMTIDVEDWFQVENLKDVISRSSWDSCESRVVNNTNRMLDLLSASEVSATFFVLGWIAERHPNLIQRIFNAGHEVAAHGYGHELIYNITPEQFRQDVQRCKDILEDLTGEAVLGYRAPSFSITDWAVDILVDLGFSYDSSAFPVNRHDRYGQLEDISLSACIKQIRPGFVEICIPCMPGKFGGLPWGGGGYFRLIPYPIFRWGIKQILRERPAYVFYIHPWEIDPRQPRLIGLKKSHSFRHYLNLDRCEYRWSHLLDEFKWVSISDLLATRNNLEIAA